MVYPDIPELKLAIQYLVLNILSTSYPQIFQGPELHYISQDKILLFLLYQMVMNNLVRWFPGVVFTEFPESLILFNRYIPQGVSV